ncbi:MAG: L,D-transpeptidase [Clostridium sp.]|uniref:L,D-transpeptidase n=1 Tax=Clostridium sp. TaxID=1506 RepID=UPI0039EAB651
MVFYPVRYSEGYYRATYTITINRNARSLTLYKDNKFYKLYPVAVGKGATPTPAGTFKIINKQINPGGPYGARWLGLSARGIGIHGTNRPGSIGGPVSHGCIRMYNKDVIELSNLVPVGTVVKII